MNTSKLFSVLLLASFAAGNVCAMEEAVDTAVDQTQNITNAQLESVLIQQGWSQTAVTVFNTWKQKAVNGTMHVVQFAQDHPYYTTAGIVAACTTAGVTVYLYKHGAIETAKQVQAKFPSLKTLLKGAGATAAGGATAYVAYKGYQNDYFGKSATATKEWTNAGFGKLRNATQATYNATTGAFGYIRNAASNAANRVYQSIPQMNQRRVLSTGVGLTAIAGSVAAYKFAQKPIENKPEQTKPTTSNKKQENTSWKNWFFVGNSSNNNGDQQQNNQTSKTPTAKTPTGGHNKDQSTNGQQPSTSTTKKTDGNSNNKNQSTNGQQPSTSTTKKTDGNNSKQQKNQQNPNASSNDKKQQETTNKNNKAALIEDLTKILNNKNLKTQELVDQAFSNLAEKHKHYIDLTKVPGFEQFHKAMHKLAHIYAHQPSNAGNRQVYKHAKEQLDNLTKHLK